MLAIDQQLFGYENGHHLLASSCKLLSGDQRTLEILSDYSGSMIPPGFDGYITGYPFLDSGYYALSMTWIANELPRPGCVWTHTLLIPFQVTSDELKQINIQDLFARPDMEIGQWKSNYEKPIKVSENINTNEKPVILSEYASSIMYYLSKQNKNLIISTENPEPYKKALIELIYGMGLSYFKEVSFCTAAFSRKKGKENLFSIQITESGTNRSVWKNTNDCEMLSSIDVKSNLTETHQIITELIGFVEGIQNRDITRGKIQCVFKLYESIMQGRIEDVLANLLCTRQAFANKEDQHKIIEKTINSLLEHQSFSTDVLIYLCIETENGQNIKDQFDEYAVEKIVDYIILRDKKELLSVIKLLLDSDLNSIGEIILQRLLKQMPLGMFETIIFDYPQTIGSIVSANWEFAKLALVWKQPYEIQCDVLLALTGVFSKTEADRHNLRDVLFAIFRHSKAPVEKQVYNVFGTYAIEMFFRWSQENPNSPNKRRWVNLCGYDLKTSIFELLVGPHEGIFADVMKVLSPNDPAMHLISDLEWRDLIERYCAFDAPNERKNALAVFLLQYILDRKRKIPEDIASFAFLEVHRILEKDNLTEAQWEKLGPLLPELKWHKMWDKCKRLRKAAKAKGYNIEFVLSTK